jgi:hypothetical protein
MPPHEAGRRYSTWFFVTPAPPDADVIVDRTEVREHRWVRPAAGLAARDGGAFPLAPPTWMTLWQLSGYGLVEAITDAARHGKPAYFETRVFPQPDGLAYVWAGDAGFDDGDLDRTGDRLRLLAPEQGPWRVEIAPAGRLAGGA